ncbi:MAG: protein-S-isoprenylcysteine O-methyltransferase [Pseudomonadota bacterium]
MTFDLEFTAKIIWCLFIVVWAAIRWQPNRKSRKTAKSVTSRSAMERFSMVVSSLGLGYIPAVWIFTDFLDGFDYEPNLLLLIVGGLILAASLRLFRLTHKALGKMWSHSLDLRENHKLVTQGIYERVRHPMYTAFWMWALGAAFLLPNWIAGLSGIICFGTLFFLRVGQEEEMMRKEFGQEYDDYMKRTKRVVPYIY